MKDSRKTTVRHANKAHKLFILSLLMFGCNSIPAHSASFNCEKAETIMEKTICSDAGLSTLDEQIAKLYADTKTELKDRPDERNDLIRDQRNWLNRLNRLKTSPCAVKPECLRDIFELQIRELGHKLKLARASVPTASGPSKDAVMERLSEQLAQLKELARKAKNVEISKTLRADKPEVCEYIWHNLQQAGVPEPTVHASTGKQKLKLYQQLREMAFHNQQLFFAQGNVVKDDELYWKRFSSKWKKYSRHFPEYDGTRMDSANLLFTQPDSDAGFKQSIFVTILLDLDQNGLSLTRDELLPDGLFNDNTSMLSNDAHSFEYWVDNLLDEPLIYESPADYAGLMTLDNKVMFWKARESSDSWSLDIRPVWNEKDEQEISCTFEF